MRIHRCVFAHCCNAENKLESGPAFVRWNCGSLKKTQPNVILQNELTVKNLANATGFRTHFIEND